MPPIPHPTSPLHDGVVHVREWTVDDAPAMRDAFRNEEMYRWTDARPDETVEEFIEAIQRGWQHREEGTRICFAIVDADDRVAGAIDLMMGELGRAEIGYGLATWARGRGYASRAVRLVGDYAFAQLGVARLELPIPLENHRSRAVAERCGYVHEGTLRSYLYLREGGPRYDIAMYARLLDESGAPVAG